MSAAPAALRIENLSVAYRGRGAQLDALRGVSFNVARGEAYGIIGESGCGKSTLALSVVRYLPVNARVSAGSIWVGDNDILILGTNELRRVRATQLAMVYQDPARALNPSMRIGEQVAEILRMRPTEISARERALAMLARVRIDRSSYDRYPHQLSGGMQQRVVIAMALSIKPEVLILDEPTTGLDATVAAEILELLGALRREMQMSILFISHDLGIVARTCERVGIMYAGELIEEGPTTQVFDEPRHPYTVGLLRSVPQLGRHKHYGRLETIAGSPPRPRDDPPGCRFAPRCGLAANVCLKSVPPLFDLGGRRSRCYFSTQVRDPPRVAQPDLAVPSVVDRSRAPLLRVVCLGKSFGAARHSAPALHDVSLELWTGETLGIVGESGSGKTTLARILVGLTAPDRGSVELDGVTLAPTSRKRRPQELKSLQIVFQNPDSALNRAHSVQRLIGRVIDRFTRISRTVRAARVLQLVRAVRLNEDDLTRRTRELSGGMKQRVAIARAFAGNPKVVVCDEPTSALDVSVQASILNLLVELQSSSHVSFVYISHDLGSVRYLSDRIAVLYRGRLLEVGRSERIFSGPHHPYTAILIHAGSGANLGAAAPSGASRDMPPTHRAAHGCVFHPRCPRKLGSVCEEREPPLRPGVDPDHQIRCHIPAAELG